jgi:hypothetical protein
VAAAPVAALAPAQGPNVAGIAALVVSGVLAAGGVALGAGAVLQREEFSQKLGERPVNEAEDAEYRASIIQKNLMADVAFGAAAASGLLAVVFFVAF